MQHQHRRSGAISLIVNRGIFSIDVLTTTVSFGCSPFPYVKAKPPVEGSVCYVDRGAQDCHQPRNTPPRHSLGHCYSTGVRSQKRFDIHNFAALNREFGQTMTRRRLVELKAPFRLLSASISQTGWRAWRWAPVSYKAILPVRSQLAPVATN